MRHTLVIRSAPALADAVKRISTITFERPLVLTVEHLDRRRSLEQNALYWATLTHISQQVKDEEGKRYSPETWHCYFKSQFLGKHTMVVDGEPVLVEKSTTGMKVMEFSEYVSKIQEWAIDHNVNFYQGGA